MKFTRRFILVPFLVLSVSSLLFSREETNPSSSELDPVSFFNSKDQAESTIKNLNSEQNFQSSPDLILQNTVSPEVINFLHQNPTPENWAIDDLPYLSAPNLDEWLEEHSRVAQAIGWFDENDESRRVINWEGWDRRRKELLRRTFQDIWDLYFNFRRMNRTPSFFPDPPPFEVYSRGRTDLPPLQYFSSEIAWRIYSTYVAHSLVLEVSESLPWSLEDYNSENLLRLLNCRKFFRPISNFVGYIPENSTAPALPHMISSFLRREEILASARSQTITQLLSWARDHLWHMTGPPTSSNFRNYYGYEFLPPISRMILGSSPSSGEFSHWTSGCAGTVSFLEWVLRSVNIPSQLLSEGGRFGNGHSQIYFPTENRYLAHGDDPYNNLVKSVPPIPIEEIMIDAATYSNWFRMGLNVSISRRVHEIAVRHLPILLLLNHCRDRTERMNAEESRVFRILSTSYQLTELQSMEPASDLWNRLDAEIERRGGCDRIPDPFSFSRSIR